MQKEVLFMDLAWPILRTMCGYQFKVSFPKKILQTRFVIKTSPSLVVGKSSLNYRSGNDHEGSSQVMKNSRH